MWAGSAGVFEAPPARDNLSGPRLQTQVFALCEALYGRQEVEQLLLPFNGLNDMAAQATARLVQVGARIRIIITDRSPSAPGQAHRTAHCRPACAGVHDAAAGVLGEGGRAGRVHACEAQGNGAEGEVAGT